METTALQTSSFRDIRTKISVMRVFLMVCVVLMHVTNYSYYSLDHTGIVYRLERTVTDHMAAICDPGFFALSGYLLFKGFDRTSMAQKMKRRLRSCLVPYIIWNLICWFFWAALDVLAEIKGVSFLNNTSRYTFSLESLINGMYIPADEPLWFLRNLIVVFALSPLIWLAMRGKAVGGGLLVVYTIYSVVMGVGLYSLVYAIYFVSLGGYLSIHYDRIVTMRYHKLAVFVSAVVFLLNLAASIIYPDWSAGNWQIIWEMLLIACLWILVDRINSGDVIKTLAGYSFFIYCIQHIPLESMEKIWFIATGDHPWAAIADYCLTPVLVIILSASLATFLSRKAPITFGYLNGGRG